MTTPHSNDQEHTDYVSAYAHGYNSCLSVVKDAVLGIYNGDWDLEAALDMIVEMKPLEISSGELQE